MAHMIYLHNFLLFFVGFVRDRMSHSSLFIVSIYQNNLLLEKMNFNTSFPFLRLNRNISSEKSPIIIIPFACTSSSQQCRFSHSLRWHIAGRETHRRWIGSESMRIGGTMYGTCNATSSCWRTTWLEWYFKVIHFFLFLIESFRSSIGFFAEPKADCAAIKFHTASYGERRYDYEI